VIVSINQPAYLPWLGYFHRIAASDLHIVLDHVQFEKNSFTNRNKVRTTTGSTWLTVPVQTSGRFGELPIDRLEIDNTSDWRRKHWQTLQQSYAKAPHFREHEAFFRELYGSPWERLADLCGRVTSYLLESFRVQTRMMSSSAMRSRGAKDELVLNLCREAGATTYLSGALGRDYLREELFKQAGIKVVYQDYHHPEYPQVYKPFEPYMAAVDLLFNCGPKSLEIIMKDQERIPA
jgi:WbqC-like protein family